MDKRTLAYWAVTGFFCLGMTGSGIMNLLRPPEIADSFAQLGFPAWFPVWLGLWKLAGVATTLAPGLARLKEWSTAGFTIVLSSAAAAHIIAGDPAAKAVAPLVILAMALGSWALRPAGRRLADHAAEAGPAGR